MNRQIRGLALVLVACFTLLFVQVNLIQVGDRSCAGAVGAATAPGTCRRNLDSDSLNRRAMLRDFTRPRGAIVTADGVVIAKSVDSHDHYVYQRVYPKKALYGQVTGYYSFVYGSSGLEHEYNDELAGQTLNQKLDSLSDLFSTTNTSGNLTVTVRDDIQHAAQRALGDRKGTVLALDPRSGNVLAMWSNPNFDPNPISAHDDVTAKGAKELLNAADDQPLLNKSYQERYLPGSSFKLVTGSVGVNTHKVSAGSPSYPVMRSYRAPVPYGQPVANFANEACGGTLFNILAMSCNSAFAQMGTETIGPKAMITGADRFGFDGKVPIDLPGPAATSTFRPPRSADDPGADFTKELPRLAQASIGQDTALATPLQMAMVVAAIAHDGKMMTPHLMDVVRDSNGKVTNSFDDKVWRQPISASTAATMRKGMRQVVTDGTARDMTIPGFDVGAKTGTAEINAAGTLNNAWMVAWGARQGEKPSVVVVAVVPNVAGKGNASTGSVIAGPVARAVLAKALGTS